MISSANNVAVPQTPAPPPGGGVLPTIYTGAFEVFVPSPGFLRLDITIEGGDAYVQFSERLDRNFDDPNGHESLLAEGTHSIPLVRWTYGWRVRSASSSAGVTIKTARAVG